MSQKVFHQQMNNSLVNFLKSIFLAETINAPSVGSPNIFQVLLFTNLAVLHNIPEINVNSKFFFIFESVSPFIENFPSGLYPVPETSIKV